MNASLQIYLFNENSIGKPIFIIGNYGQLEKVLDILREDLLSRFCYTYRSDINNILYEFEKIINIKNNEYNNSFFFYLVLSIKNNPDIVNYEYNFDLINDLYEKNKDERKELKKFIVLKIIQELIINYLGIELSENEEIKTKIDKIQNYCREYSHQSINILKEFNVPENIVNNINLESFFCEIIKYIIKNEKIMDEEYVEDIMQQIDFINIKITKNMFDNLFNIPDSDESYVGKYLISEKEDLFNKKKIQFYYFLIKYILKDEIYIYNIPFLFKTRKFIINLLKQKNFFGFNSNYDNIKEKQYYILKALLNCDYYYNKYFKGEDIKAKLNIILVYYENYKFESKANEINLIKDIIKKMQGNYEPFLEDLNKAKEMNEKYEIIKLFYDAKYNEKKENNLNSCIESWDIIAKGIKDKKIKKLRAVDKKAIFEIFNENNKKLLFNHFKQEDYDFVISKSLEKIKESKENKKSIENKNKLDKDKIKTILNYYKNYYFESKKNDIDLIERALRNDEIETIYEKYKNDYDEAKKMNDRYNIIDYIYNLKNKEDNQQKNESDIKKDIDSWNKLEGLILDNKFKKMQKKSKNKLFDYLNENNKETLLQIFSEETYNIIVNENQRNLNEIKKKELKNLLNEYKKNFPETRKNEIILIENLLSINNIPNNNNYNFEDILKRFSQIYLFIQKKNQIEQTEKIEKALQIWNDLEKKINEKNVESIAENKNNPKELVEILWENAYDYFIEKKDINSNENNKNKENYISQQFGIISTGSSSLIPLQKEDEDPLIKEKKKLAEKILTESEIILLKNKKNAKVFFEKDEIKYREGNIEIDILKQNIGDLDNQYKQNYENFFEFIEEVKENIENGFENNYDLKIKLQFKKEEKRFLDTLYNISCKYTFYPPNKDDIKAFKDDNILVNKTNSLSQGFNYLILEINDSKYEDRIIKENQILAYEILTESEIKFHTNKKGEQPFIIYDEINYGYKNIKIDIRRLNQIKQVIDDIDDQYSQNYKYYLDFIKEFEEKIEKEFNHNYNLKLKLKFKREEKNDNRNNDKIIYNISCEYTFYPPTKDGDIVFKDDNIFGSKSPIHSHFLLLEIDDEKYNNIDYSEENEKIIKNQSEISTRIDSVNNNPQIRNDSNNINESNSLVPRENFEIKIIEFMKVMGTHEDTEKDKRNCYTAEFIKELSNGYFISGGTDYKLKIYTKDFNIYETFGKIDIVKEWIYNICERQNNKEKSNSIIQLITCSNKEIFLIDIDFTKSRLNYKKYELPSITCTNCIEMEDNNFVMLGLKGACYFYDLFSRRRGNSENYYSIVNKTYRGAIKISDDLVALCSNKIAIQGEDRLIFFNPNKEKKKKIVHEIKDYSFNFSVNALSLFPKKENESKKRILLCACKKYCQNQNNGILIVNANLDKKNIKNPFYNTGEFEVFAFCPIEVNEDKMIEDSRNIKTIVTDYFLVGGFDNEKREGKIKLYKVNFSENIENTNIEFIQDIEFQKDKDFQGFQWPISCIIQSSSYSNILITSYDGKVYLFSSPNLDFYLKKDNIFDINIFDE